MLTPCVSYTKIVYCKGRTKQQQNPEQRNQTPNLFVLIRKSYDKILFPHYETQVHISGNPQSYGKPQVCLWKPGMRNGATGSSEKPSRTFWVSEQGLCGPCHPHASAHTVPIFWGFTFALFPLGYTPLFSRATSVLKIKLGISWERIHVT